MTSLQAIKQAEQLFHDGDLAQAEKVCVQILKLQPDFAPAHFQLGLIAARSQELQQAEALVTRAIECDGSVSRYHQLLCDIHRNLGQFEKAVTAGWQAVKLAPEDAEAWYLLALACRNAGQNSDAIQHYHKALHLNPQHDKAANNLGVTLQANGNIPEAEKFYARAAQTNPRNAEAHNNLGAILYARGDIKSAKECFSAALQANPEFTPAQKNLAALRNILPGRPQPPPQDGESHFLLGLAFANNGQPDKAMQHYSLTLQHSPAHDRAANNMGTVLEKIGDEKTAQEFYERAIRVNPRNAEAQNNLGALLSARGELDRARQCLNAAIEADPFFIHAHYNLSTIKKYTPDDPHLIALEKLTAKADSLSAEAQMRLWFSLGKAWEDVKRYDESFAAYDRGNRIHRAAIAYDEKAVAKSTDDIVRRFDKKLADKKVKGSADETPIFIVGMPRSGTTLIEQIISNHSAVFGAGELRDLCDTVAEQWKIGPGLSYIDRLKAASEEELVTIGESYLRKIRKLNTTALRITDKMPGNYFYTGLIHKIFPNARIIHSIRDPRDTCFSNYSRLFQHTMPFAYDLQELGRYYRRYEELMRHWKRVLPKNAILDVRYEDVVADLEGQTRRLLDYCGLSWEARCLAFHENIRTVKTASIAQVREPIYKSSIARWEHYREHLEPLRLALEGKDATASTTAESGPVLHRRGR